MNAKAAPRQPSADVQVDEEGRIVVSAPELAEQLRQASLSSSGAPQVHGAVNNGCNLVPGCGAVQM